MSTEHDGGVLGVVAAALGLCCGLPLLLSAGVGLATVGVVVGSVALVTLAGTVMAVGAWRRRMRRANTDEGRHHVR